MPAKEKALDLSFMLVQWMGSPTLDVGVRSSHWSRLILTFDLGVLHKESREIGVKESLKLSALYISLGLAVRRLGVVVSRR
jgi:tellurite resistance protein TerC